jgi:hypothetical protein
MQVVPPLPLYTGDRLAHSDLVQGGTVVAGYPCEAVTYGFRYTLKPRGPRRSAARNSPAKIIL